MPDPEKQEAQEATVEEAASTSRKDEPTSSRPTRVTRRNSKQSVPESTSAANRQVLAPRSTPSIDNQKNNSTESNPARALKRKRADLNETKNNSPAPVDAEDTNSGDVPDEEARERRGPLTEHLLENSKGKIRVGSEHQALLGIESKVDREFYTDRDERDDKLWIPPTEKAADFDDQMTLYLEEAWARNKIPPDRAMYILYKCGYDYEKAIKELDSRIYVEDHWSGDDRLIFYQLFGRYGKRFDLIQRSLPHRSIHSIVDHYYETKRMSNYKGAYRSRIEQEDDDDDDEAADNEFGSCENCGERQTKISYVAAGRLCMPCRIYHSVAHQHRPTTGNRPRFQHHVPKCPSDMLGVIQVFEEMAGLYASEANQPQSHAAVVQSLENMIQQRSSDIKTKIFKVRAEVQTEHQKIEKLKECLQGGVDKYRHYVVKEQEDENKTKRARFSNQWTPKERMIAIHCLARYGNDNPEAVARVIGTKRKEHVEAFYSENRDQLEDYLQKVERQEEKRGRNLDHTKEIFPNGLKVEDTKPS
ncbi:unnamed protein product, partial [Mesorhabditis spiculigera]